jgi:CRISPR system Cascade subunit CasE
MSLHLMHCTPDPRALAAWSVRHGFLSPDGEYGYALHALLQAAFGEAAPKPFRYLDPRRGLLAYTDTDRDQLREHAALAAPDIARALGLDALDARTFPSSWRSGQRLGFEVRVRPVIRAKDGRERDAYLHAVEPLPRDSGSSVDRPQRESIYRDWLARHMDADGAANLLDATMDAFRLTRVLRRAAADEQGKRKARTPAGPDAIFKGRLEIGDGDAFARLVQHGIGRHRSFGFGMLLLKPASPC